MRPLALTTTLLAALALPALAADPCTSLGKGVTLEAATAATAILADPAAFAGREVRVDGTVRDVCRMAGCWLELVPDGTTGAAADAAALRVKVQDGEIVFPMSSIGKPARAQGTVDVREMTKEQWAAWQKHLAEERGGTFDPATLGEGPFRRVQVLGTGATICD